MERRANGRVNPRNYGVNYGNNVINIAYVIISSIKYQSYSNPRVNFCELDIITTLTTYQVEHRTKPLGMGHVSQRSRSRCALRPGHVL